MKTRLFLCILAMMLLSIAANAAQQFKEVVVGEQTTNNHITLAPIGDLIWRIPGIDPNVCAWFPGDILLGGTPQNPAQTISHSAILSAVKAGNLGSSVLTVAPSGAQYTTVQAAVNAAVAAGGWIPAAGPNSPSAFAPVNSPCQYVLTCTAVPLNGSTITFFPVNSHPVTCEFDSASNMVTAGHVWVNNNDTGGRNDYTMYHLCANMCAQIFDGEVNTALDSTLIVYDETWNDHDSTSGATGLATFAPGILASPPVLSAGLSGKIALVSTPSLPSGLAVYPLGGGLYSDNGPSGVVEIAGGTYTENINLTGRTRLIGIGNPVIVGNVTGNGTIENVQVDGATTITPEIVNPSLVDLLHSAQTTSATKSYKINGYSGTSVVFYDPNRDGIVTDLVVAYATSTIVPNNYWLRVYTGIGSLPNPTSAPGSGNAFATAATGDQTLGADLDLNIGSLMGYVYNAVGTRVYDSALIGVRSTVNMFDIHLKVPVPYQNGCLIQLLTGTTTANAVPFTQTANMYCTTTFSNNIPYQSLRNWRLRSQTVPATVLGNVKVDKTVFTVTNKPGTLLGMWFSLAHFSHTDPDFIWSTDANVIAYSAPGIEDLFVNSWFWPTGGLSQSAANCGADSGTIYVATPGLGGTDGNDNTAECYRFWTRGEVSWAHSITGQFLWSKATGNELSTTAWEITNLYYSP